MYGAEHGFKFVESGNWIEVFCRKFGIRIQSLSRRQSDVTRRIVLVECTTTQRKAYATPITLVGLIGSFEGSGWGTDIPMEFNPETLTYSATIALKEGDEFKIRFNRSWDLNLGGDPQELTAGGANIVVQNRYLHGSTGYGPPYA